MYIYKMLLHTCYIVTISYFMFRRGAFAEQVNWEVFRGLIKQVEEGVPISYEHFFELALFEIVSIRPACVRRRVRDSLNLLLVRYSALSFFDISK